MTRTRRAVVLTLALGLGLSGCAGGAASGIDAAGPDGGGGPDGAIDPGGDGGAAAPGRERSCDTELRFTPDRPAATVELVGSWDWNHRQALGDPDGDGTFVAIRQLAAGTYAYKLIVDGEWILDPGQPARIYDGGVENSALRVDDCRQPALELLGVEPAADGITARIRVWRGAGGPAVQVAATRRHDYVATDVDVALAIDAGAAGAAGDLVATVAVHGLAAGKHTVEVTAVDDAGQPAGSVVLPFWIEAAAFDWRSPIYMVMVDRFRNGDPGNDAASPGATPSADWWGGDLAGVTAAIEDGTFAELGVQALWLSPFVRNPDGAHDDAGHRVSGYHGYWPTRARELDPRFGSAADLEALVRAAHRRGIRVLMDLVWNHVHADHEYATGHPDWFRTGCTCGTDGCDWTGHRLDCLFRDYLPDLDWTRAAAADAFVADALWWLERFDLDGFRVDAVKHVEDLAIGNLSAAIHARLEGAGTEYFLLGETAMGWAGHDVAANLPEYATISRYLGPFALSGQFDFVLYHAAAYRVFARDEYGLIHADFWTHASLEHYPASAIMTPYLGSHDTARFLSLAADGGRSDVPDHKWPEQGLPGEPTTDEPYRRTAVALTWLLGLPGAPLLYYGDEYGEWGGSDPDNRHMWRAPAQRSARERGLHDVVARAGRARQASVALRRGGYRTVAVDDGFLCFAREAEGDVALVVLNHGAAAVTRTIDVPAGPAALVDALAAGAPPRPVVAGRLEVTVPAHGAMLLVPH